jgi:hypothetical protein
MEWIFGGGDLITPGTAAALPRNGNENTRSGESNSRMVAGLVRNT